MKVRLRSNFHKNDPLHAISISPASVATSSITLTDVLEVALRSLPIDQKAPTPTTEMSELECCQTISSLS